MLFTRRVLSFVEPDSNVPGRSEEPIRAELFSPERMEGHAESLAAAQRIVAAGSLAYRPIDARSHDNGRVLLDCYQTVATAAREKKTITPAAEWLLDNFHVVEDELRELERGLTPRYCRSLPALLDGPLAGYPRAYGVAWAFVAHTDSRFDATLLRRFLLAYQRVETLNMREVWAVPLMLGCVLIENLRRLGERMAASQTGRRDADAFADELLALGNQSAQAADGALRALSDRRLTRAFAVQLIQRLRYQDISLQRLNEKLAAQGMDADALVQSEHTSQSAANLTVRNIITSMRTMAAFDWQNWFEEVSAVDACLRRSPAFGGMDFATRDRYRHALEELALGSRHSELDIARAVIARSAQAEAEARPGIPGSGSSDPGYYLISTGRREFEREIDFRPSLRQRILRAHVSHAPAAYFGANALVALAIVVLPLLLSLDSGVGAAVVAVLALLGIFPAYDIAVVLVNNLVTTLLGPRHLPRLQLEQGVPDSLRTFVVVPTMLTSEVAIKEQIEHLEAHYLSNSAGGVCFGLLSIGPMRTLPGRADDARLLDARGGRHRRVECAPTPAAWRREHFHLFPSSPPSRGTQQKMDGLGTQARQAARAQSPAARRHGPRFLRPHGRVQTVKVCAMSSRWTPTPTCRDRRHAAGWHDGAPAEPAVFDPARQRGRWLYDAQPRVTPTSPIGSREFALPADIFRCPVSTSTRTPGGIRCLSGSLRRGHLRRQGHLRCRRFQSALAGRVPENAMLSHDLFEGVFARAGLVCDIDLFGRISHLT